MRRCTPGTEEAGESATGFPPEEAQALCAEWLDADDCESVVPANGQFFCAWRELAVIEVNACTQSEVTGECLAFADGGFTPGCVPNAGCTEPVAFEGVTYLRPAWRTEEGVTVLVDACGGYLPVGFESCTYDGMDAPICACACTGVPE